MNERMVEKLVEGATGLINEGRKVMSALMDLILEKKKFSEDSRSVLAALTPIIASAAHDMSKTVGERPSASAVPTEVNEGAFWILVHLAEQPGFVHFLAGFSEEAQKAMEKPLTEIVKEFPEETLNRLLAEVMKYNAKKDVH